MKCKKINLIILGLGLSSMSVAAQSNCDYWSGTNIHSEINNANSLSFKVDIEDAIQLQNKSVDWYQSLQPNFEVSSEGSHLLGTTTFEEESAKPVMPQLLTVKQNTRSHQVEYISLTSGSGFKVSDLWIRDNNHGNFDKTDLVKFSEADKDDLNLLYEGDHVPENAILIVLLNDFVNFSSVLDDFNGFDQCALYFLKYDSAPINPVHTAGCMVRYLVGIEENVACSSVTFSSHQFRKDGDQIVLNTKPAVLSQAREDVLNLSVALNKVGSSKKGSLVEKVLVTNKFPHQTSYVKGIIRGEHVNQCCGLVSPEIKIEPKGKKALNSQAAPLTLFPNPAGNMINSNIFKEGEYRYKIWSADGKLVAQSGLVSNVNSINVSMLKAGIYSIEIIEVGGATSFGRFTKIE